MGAKQGQTDKRSLVGLLKTSLPLLAGKESEDDARERRKEGQVWGPPRGRVRDGRLGRDLLCLFL